MPTETQEPSNATALEHFSRIGDVPITIWVQLDKRQITFGELLGMHEGQVIVFGRPAGENVDLYAGEALIGSGEILVVDSALAVRVASLREAQAKEGQREEQIGTANTDGEPV
jgi:flagellar motor switch/type III secretory pathway protein FliN